jgi:uncharacterized OB-fold protein
LAGYCVREGLTILATTRTPVITSQLAKHFWDACARGEYLLQACANCGRYRYPVSRICPGCMSRDFDWKASRGFGAVFTFTVVDRAPSPAFAPYTPYVVALVDLEEGVRVMGNIIDGDPSSVTVGMPVSVRFQKIDDETTLPQFGPR